MKDIFSSLSILGDTLTLLLAGGQGERLYPLTRERAKPAIPFAGNFRLIDFTLSNCVNSGIRRIYVLTQYMSSTLDRHIRDGWNLFSSQLGEFIQTVPPQRKMAMRWYEGTADAIFHNIGILEKEASSRVLILSGDHLYKMNYENLLQFHITKKADLTVAGLEMDKEEAKRLGVLEVDTNSRIVAFKEKSLNPRTVSHDNSKCLVSMGVYVFNTKKLVRALIKDARKDSEHDFGKNIVPQMLASGDNLYCYDFSAHNLNKTGYWRDIGTIDSYWQASMDLVELPPKFNLYDEGWPIRTYQEQNPPTKVVSDKKGGRGTLISDCLICNSCHLTEAKIEKSILSPRVGIDSFAEVSESVIMKGTKVGKYSKIRRAIIDERVIIPDGYKIGYNLKDDAAKFTVSPLGIVLVPEEIHLD
jgi:glucose-1-phosphate adenylyltransferase